MPLIHWEDILFYLLIATTAVQLFYYLYFFARLSFFKPREKTQSQTHPVSVIICARDEDENLARNLPGVLVQQYHTSYEVLVVNDNSLDDSKYILEELRKTFKNLHIVELTQEAKLIAGKKYPLSIGIREAKHEVILLTDADCVPAAENWIDKMQDGYDNGIEVVIGYGAYHKKPGLLNKLIRFETVHSAIQYFSYAMAGLPYMGVGRNLSYKKSLFLNNKGFSSINHLPGGDDDLFINKVANKHNTAIVFDAEASTLSVPKKTWKEWRKQKRRHYTTAKYYKPVHKFLLSLYAGSQFIFYPLAAATAIWFDWRMAVGIVALRLITQFFVFYKPLKKLGEGDLFGWLLFFDLWLFFYYLLFAPSLFRKAKKTW